MTGKQPEKRSNERRACSGGAEVRTTSDGRGQWAVLTDISLSGCYIQTPSPLPVKTRLSLLLRAHETELVTPAVVSTCDPGVGMGVEFTDMSPENKDRLQKLFAQLG